jgi:hypothetical protein
LCSASALRWRPRAARPARPVRWTARGSGPLSSSRISWRTSWQAVARHVVWSPCHMHRTRPCVAHQAVFHWLRSLAGRGRLHTTRTWSLWAHAPGAARGCAPGAVCAPRARSAQVPARNSSAARRRQGSYGVAPYFASKLAAESPIGALFPLLFAALVYPAAGLHPRLSRSALQAPCPLRPAGPPGQGAWEQRERRPRGQCSGSNR